MADAERHPLCPVHLREPSLPCVRCGTFVCATCIGTSEVICDRCDERLFAAVKSRRDGHERVLGWAGGVLMVLFVALLLALNLGRL